MLYLLPVWQDQSGDGRCRGNRYPASQPTPVPSIRPFERVLSSLPSSWNNASASGAACDAKGGPDPRISVSMIVYRAHGFRQTADCGESGPASWFDLYYHHM